MSMRRKLSGPEAGNTQSKPRKGQENEADNGMKKKLIYGGVLLLLAGMVGTGVLLGAGSKDGQEIAAAGSTGALQTAKSLSVQQGQQAGMGWLEEDAKKKAGEEDEEMLDMGNGLRASLDKTTGEVTIYDTSSGSGTITTSVRGLMDASDEELAEFEEQLDAAVAAGDITPAQYKKLKGVIALATTEACDPFDFTKDCNKLKSGSGGGGSQQFGGGSSGSGGSDGDSDVSSSTGSSAEIAAASATSTTLGRTAENASKDALKTRLAEATKDLPKDLKKKAEKAFIKANTINTYRDVLVNRATLERQIANQKANQKASIGTPLENGARFANTNLRGNGNTSLTAAPLNNGRDTLAATGGSLIKPVRPVTEAAATGLSTPVKTPRSVATITGADNSSRHSVGDSASYSGGRSGNSVAATHANSNSSVSRRAATSQTDTDRGSGDSGRDNNGDWTASASGQYSGLQGGSTATPTTRPPRRVSFGSLMSSTLGGTKANTSGTDSDSDSGSTANLDSILDNQ